MKKIAVFLLVLSLSVMLFACASKTITAKPIVVTDPTEETTTAPTETTTVPFEEEEDFFEDEMGADADAAISAVSSALNGNGISMSALQTQLESEGYGIEAIMVALNATTIDWNAQAAKAAKTAMADPMSPAALEDLLTAEGFTAEQAAYGVANCGDWNAYALAYAKQHYAAMESTELEAQLITEGFTAAQATYAAANI